ncbi:hypothetical protein C8D92_102352 [Tamilnaduibacter salinus]|uniref:Sulfotransferase domain-containing protein n=1 Tax=Tamilnaduibacter salinus TaxID=1484056 RepID=A0A2U1D028_9GAMM|nr:hypothetical protein [Tamilnaduibacter salinus]PVY78311.1 hypothetical protein C8D92_102352 [Tamilnaduibacter salinus]
MKRYVISTQRSGLNWLRYNIEYHTGLRTPGKELLVSKDTQKESCFIRSHDPMGVSYTRSQYLKEVFSLSKKISDSAWNIINPQRTKNDVVILLLRDYREVFVRTANKNYRKFDVYLSNIRFLNKANTNRKKVFYYEDFVKNPETMSEMLSFLQLPETEGDHLSLDNISNTWDKKAAASVDKYSVNQAAGGGAMTKNNRYDFKHHQQELNQEELDSLDRYINDSLTDSELSYLFRYRS